MNEAELRVLRETLSTIGAAVTELAGIVEGLPKVLTSRIGEFHAEMRTCLAAQAETLAEHVTSAASRAAQVDAIFEGLRVKHAEFEAHLQIMNESLHGDIKSAVDGVQQVIADNRAADQLALKTGLQDVRTACDTTDIFHRLALLDGTVKTLAENTTVAELTAKVEEFGPALGNATRELGARIDAFCSTTEAAFGERIAGIHATLSGLGDTVNSVNQSTTRSREDTAVVIQRLNQRVDDEISKVTSDVEAVAAASGERCATLEVRLTGVAEKQAEHHATVVSIVDTATAAMGSKVATALEKAEALAAPVAALRESIEQTATALGERCAVLDTRITGVAEKQAEHHATLFSVVELTTVLDSKTTAALGKADALAAPVAALREGIEQTATVFGERCAVLDTRIAGLAEAQTERFATTGEAIAKVAASTAALEHPLAALREGIEQTAAESAKAVSALAASTTERIDGVERTLDGTSKELEGLRTTVEGFQKTADELSEGFGKNYLDIDARVRGVEDYVHTELNTQAQSIASLTTGVNAQLEQNHKANTEFITESVGAVRLGLVGRIDTTAAQISELGVEVAAVREGLGATTAELTEAIKTVALLPVAVPELSPEQMAELQVRVASALPVPEMPALESPQFTLAYEEDQLVVSMAYGDQVQKVSVPVEIGIDYKGAYAGDPSVHRAGHFVSHKGSLWACVGTPTDAPGKDYTGWRLAVKCGRDGADATPPRVYVGNKAGRKYRNADFLRLNNRLWQCAAAETQVVPEPGDISSTTEWILIGGVQ